MKTKIFALLLLFTSFAHADTFEATYNTAQWVPVYLADATDGITPETAIVYTDVTFYYKQGVDGTWTQLTLAANACTTTSGYWCNEDSTNAPGSYSVYVPTTVTNSKGKLFYLVKGACCRTYLGLVSVKTNNSATESDNIDSILTDTGTTLPGTLGSPAGSSMSADIAAIKADTTTFAGQTYTVTSATSATVFSSTDITADSLLGRAVAFPTNQENSAQSTSCNVEGEYAGTVTAYSAGQLTVSPGLSATPNTNCEFVYY